MTLHSLKPFDAGNYFSEQEALNQIKKTPTPKKTESGKKDKSPEAKTDTPHQNDTPNIDLENRTIEPPQTGSKYEWQQYNNYAEGVHELKRNGRKPFTFKKNLEARLQDKKLFKTYLDSCTAIIYSGGNKFKIEIESKDLRDIPKNNNEPKLTTNYGTSKGIELDRTKDKYNELLTKEEFLNHKGYDVVFGNDRQLKEKYATEVYDNQGKTEAMAFLLLNNAAKGDLLALCLDNIVNSSNALGHFRSLINARLLREVAPTK